MPPGFRIEEYATGIPEARFMVLGPDARVWVSDMATGAVHVLESRKPRRVISGLDRPYGLAFWKDWLYVAEASSVKRLPQFPERYRGGAFVALYGSWNRSRLAGYGVVFVPFQDGRPAAGPESFVSGFLPDPAIAKVRGRPVGLLQLPDGSLLVSDDGGGLIWRVSYRAP